jgi:hypothetical protein
VAVRQIAAVSFPVAACRHRIFYHQIPKSPFEQLKLMRMGVMQKRQSELMCMGELRCMCVRVGWNVASLHDVVDNDETIMTRRTPNNEAETIPGK